MTDDAITISAGPRFRAAMILAIIADALQIAVFPLFVGGAMSPADDVLDFGVGALMVHLLGCLHWEFLPPSFFAKLVPGSRFGSFLDPGGRQRLSRKVEADCGGQCGGGSAIASGVG